MSFRIVRVVDLPVLAAVSNKKEAAMVRLEEGNQMVHPEVAGRRIHLVIRRAAAWEVVWAERWVVSAVH